MERRGAKILLVEDDPYDRDLILRAFRESNLADAVVTADDGVQALDYLFKPSSGVDEAQFNCPALILLDLQVSKIKGLEVLRRIRNDARTQAIPVIVYTSSEDERDTTEVRDLMVSGYIHKPATYNELCKVVEEIQFYWLIVNGNEPQDGRLGGTQGSVRRGSASRFPV
jgi:two-component system response regulator